MDRWAARRGGGGLGGGGAGEGAGNLVVIVVRMCESVFQNLPIHTPGL